MLKKTQENFKRGVEKIKWFSTLFSERLNIEIAIFKLLYQSDEMGKKRGEHLKEIGERVVDLKEQGEKNIFRDSAIIEALDEIEKIDRHIEDLRHQASDLSRVTS